MDNQNIFDSQSSALMFYHTSLRNIIVLTTFSFMILTFIRKIKFNFYNIIIRIVSLIVSIIALYFNINLINLFSNEKSEYVYLKNYLIVNYAITFILLLIIMFLFMKTLNNYFS